MMVTIEDLVALEWEQFQRVQNEGGTASCQNNKNEFILNREAQFITWSEAMRESYYRDLQTAEANGWNLLTEKYARMMQYTAPDAYETLADRLPPISEDKRRAVDHIVAIQVEWQKEYVDRFPKIALRSRPTGSTQDTYDTTSFETYLRCELYTYSEETLQAYVAHADEMQAAGKNMTLMDMEYIAKGHGFGSLQAMEDSIR